MVTEGIQAKEPVDDCPTEPAQRGVSWQIAIISEHPSHVCPVKFLNERVPINVDVIIPPDKVPFERSAKDREEYETENQANEEFWIESANDRHGHL